MAETTLPLHFGPLASLHCHQGHNRQRHTPRLQLHNQPQYQLHAREEVDEVVEALPDQTNHARQSTAERSEAD